MHAEDDHAAAVDRVSARGRRPRCRSASACRCRGSADRDDAPRVSRMASRPSAASATTDSPASSSRLSQPAPHDAVIVSQQHAQAAPPCSAIGTRQMDRRASCPCPVAAAIVMVPCSSLTRSSMPRSPSPSRRRAGSNPTPSSATDTSSRSSTPVDAHVDRCAPARAGRSWSALPASRDRRRSDGGPAATSRSPRTSSSHIDAISADDSRGRAIRAPAAGRSRRACWAAARAPDRGRFGTSGRPAVGTRRRPRPTRASTVGRVALDPAQLHPQRRQHLRDVIVQFARQVLPLLFLRRDEPLRELRASGARRPRRSTAAPRIGVRARAAGTPRSARRRRRAARVCHSSRRRSSRNAACRRVTSARCASRLALFSSSISCAIARIASRRGTTSCRRKARAAKDLFGRRPVEQRLERLPVFVELRLQIA